MGSPRLPGGPLLILARVAVGTQRGLQASSIVRPTVTPELERPQEVDDVLPLSNSEPVKTVDDLICLATLAPVGFDGLHQIACPSVMKEKHALPDTPQWC